MPPICTITTPTVLGVSRFSNSSTVIENVWGSASTRRTRPPANNIPVIVAINVLVGAKTSPPFKFNARITASIAVVPELVATAYL